MSMFKKLEVFIRVLVKIETIMSLIILGTMWLIGTLEIFARIFFRHSFLWSVPAMLILFSWLTFIGAAVIFYHKEYIIVEYFVDRFFARYKRLISVVVNALVVVFIMFVVYEIFGIIKMQTYKIEIIKIPQYSLSIPLLIALLTIFLIYLRRICLLLRSRE
jgi:TRAP-type C4-dicarboxylate transport system permease small subunit